MTNMSGQMNTIGDSINIMNRQANSTKHNNKPRFADHGDSINVNNNDTVISKEINQNEKSSFVQ